MLIITKYPEKYDEKFRQEHEVIDQFQRTVNTTRLSSQIGCKEFRNLYGTASGPCLITGMGASRLALVGKKVKYPIFAINRSILDFPEARYWCAQDLDSVSDCCDKIAANTLITYAGNIRKPAWGEIKVKDFYLMEMHPDPRRNSRRPLFWNQTTFGWTIDLAFRMGHDVAYVVGVDKSTGSYKNPHFSDEELAKQHRGVRERIEEMFLENSVGAWNLDRKEVVDLAEDGYLPVRKGTLEEVLC